MQYKVGICKELASFYLAPFNFRHEHNATNVLKKVSVGWRPRRQRNQGYVVEIRDYIVGLDDFSPCQDERLVKTLIVDFTEVLHPIVITNSFNLTENKVFHRVEGEASIDHWFKIMKNLLPLKLMKEEAFKCFEMFRLRAFGYNVDKERSILKGKGLLREGEIISERLAFLMVTLFSLIMF